MGSKSTRVCRDQVRLLYPRDLRRQPVVDRTSNMIVLNPVRRYQWGGASIQKTDARIVDR
jgi:hypothetical protein